MKAAASVNRGYVKTTIVTVCQKLLYYVCGFKTHLCVVSFQQGTHKLHAVGFDHICAVQSTVLLQHGILVNVH